MPRVGGGFHAVRQLPRAPQIPSRAVRLNPPRPRGGGTLPGVSGGCFLLLLSLIRS